MAFPETKFTFDRARASRMWGDHVSEVLYQTAAPAARGYQEQTIIYRVKTLLARLRKEWMESASDENGEVIREMIEDRLAKLDAWLFPQITGNRLSGDGILDIARFVDSSTAVKDSWIRVMPGLKYRNEEIARGRSWAALLEPETLLRLKQAILIEKQTY